MSSALLFAKCPQQCAAKAQRQVVQAHAYPYAEESLLIFRLLSLFTNCVSLSLPMYLLFRIRVWIASSSLGLPRYDSNTVSDAVLILTA